MRYEEMIQTEGTDCLYDVWHDYREELTAYIIASIEHACIRERLREEEILRPKKTYNIEEILKTKAEKPVLAIWGAGGCNDIDIVRLSNYFKLVLIDRDVDKIKAARQRFGLREEDCLCVNLHFWNIEHEDYKLFEALLLDEAKTDEVECFLRDMVGNMITPDYSDLPNFDYSVVVGLASQLNIRFAAMAHMYGMYEMLAPVLREMNELAVQKLMYAVERMTRKQIILGYEAQNVDMCSEKDVENLCMRYDEETESMCPISGSVTIAGNDVLEKYVCLQVEGGQWRILCHKALLWPFSQKKKYLMMNLSFVRQEQ